MNEFPAFLLINGSPNGMNSYPKVLSVIECDMLCIFVANKDISKSTEQREYLIRKIHI